MKKIFINSLIFSLVISVQLVSTQLVNAQTIPEGYDIIKIGSTCMAAEEYDAWVDMGGGKHSSSSSGVTLSLDTGILIGVTSKIEMEFAQGDYVVVPLSYENFSDGKFQYNEYFGVDPVVDSLSNENVGQFPAMLQLNYGETHVPEDLFEFMCKAEGSFGYVYLVKREPGPLLENFDTTSLIEPIDDLVLGLEDVMPANGDTIKATNDAILATFRDDFDAAYTDADYDTEFTDLDGLDVDVQLAVTRLGQLGILTGPGGLDNPDPRPSNAANSIIRAEYAALMQRAFDVLYNTDTSGVELYADVPDGQWFSDPFRWMIANGVYEQGRPSDTLNVVEACTVLVRVLGLELIHPTSSPYPNIDKGHWSLPYVYTLDVHEILPEDFSDLEPSNPATRGFVALLIANAVE